MKGTLIATPRKSKRRPSRRKHNDFVIYGVERDEWDAKLLAETIVALAQERVLARRDADLRAEPSGQSDVVVRQ